MELEMQMYTRDRIPDVVDFEKRLRQEEDFWICVIKSSRHQGVAQRLLENLRQILKDRHIDTLLALTAANEEAQRFYQSVPDSVMRDIGIWIDIK